MLVATYKERQNIESLIGKISQTAAPCDILVIDDSSPDGTSEAVRQIMRENSRVRLVQRPQKLGLGSAYLLGFREALSNGYSAVCTIDADHSHDPAQLADMLALLDRFDVVIGSRYCAGGRILNWGVLRRINSKVANSLARLFVSRTVHDFTSGYRIYRTALLRRMHLSALASTGYCMLVELIYEATAAGGRITEFPIVFKDREAGVSKINSGEITDWLKTLCVLWLRSRRARRRLF